MPLGINKSDTRRRILRGPSIHRLIDAGGTPYLEIEPLRFLSLRAAKMEAKRKRFK